MFAGARRPQTQQALLRCLFTNWFKPPPTTPHCDTWPQEVGAEGAPACWPKVDGAACFWVPGIAANGARHAPLVGEAQWLSQPIGLERGPGPAPASDPESLKGANPSQDVISPVSS
jgi:hypothetical protein